MNRLLRFVVLSILLIAVAPALQAQQDSGKAKSYEEYEQQQNAEAAPAEATPAADDEQYTTTEQDESEGTAVETQNGYSPLFVKPEGAPEQRDRQLSAAQWQQLTNDPDFQYEEPPQPKPEKDRKPSAWELFLESIAAFFLSGGGQVILIVIVALIVIFLVVRTVQLKGNIFFSRKDKKLLQEEVAEDADEYVPNNWDQAIQQAVAAGNYRLAIRHSYRYMLQLLQEKELIRFQAAKTNYQYAYELAGTSLYKPFMQLTRHYEYAWYGGFDIARDRFDIYYEQIKGLKAQLN